MMRKAASMGLRDLVYRLFERRLAAALSPDAIPRHVGVMCDGNRRWARSAGFRDIPPFGDYAADPWSVFMEKTL